MQKHFQDPFPTPHLMKRLKDRNITWAEIVEILDSPENVYGPDFQGRKVMQKGDLSIVVGPQGAVITVLLRQEDQWNDEAMRNRMR